jgi:pyruvate formate lyase activating enzyme
MNGVIFDIKRFAVNDGPGIRTTVFLKGCPLRCSWCHNPEGIKENPEDVSRELKLNGRSFTKEETAGTEISAAELFAELEKERIFMDESGGGVTFSGGEPFQQFDFLMEILKICKTNGMHTAVDTSLYVSWDKIKAASEYIDLFLVDLKLMDSAAHQHYTGVPNGLILNNIEKLSAIESAVIIRIPVIPNVTDPNKNILQSISFLKDLKGKVKEVHLLPFHCSANEKYKRIGRENQFGHQKSMQKVELLDIENQFINAGFAVKIGG